MSDPLSMSAAGFSVIDYIIKLIKLLFSIVKPKYVLKFNKYGVYKGNKKRLYKIITKCLINSKYLNQLKVELFENRNELKYVKPIYKETVVNELSELELNIIKCIILLCSNEAKQVYSFYKLEDKIIGIIEKFLILVQKPIEPFLYHDYTQLDIFININHLEICVVFKIDNQTMNTILVTEKIDNIKCLITPSMLDFKDLIKYINIEDFLLKCFTI